MGSLHVVSGSRKTPTQKHKVPGKTKDAQDRFKMEVVTNALKILLAAPAAPQGPRPHLLLGGDFNLLGRVLPNGLVSVSGMPDVSVLCGQNLEHPAQPRDWIVSTVEIEGVPMHSPVIAQDRAHHALIVEWQPGAEAPAAPQGPSAPPGSNIEEQLLRVRDGMFEVSRKRREAQAAADLAEQELQDAEERLMEQSIAPPLVAHEEAD